MDEVPTSTKVTLLDGTPEVDLPKPIDMSVPKEKLASVTRAVSGIGRGIATSLAGKGRAWLSATLAKKLANV